MIKSNIFPKELLKVSLKERLDYFKSYTVAHPNLIETDKLLKQAIYEPAGASLIFVYGPTGVGKTTLKRRIEKLLIEENIERMNKDKGFIPVISTEAVAPDSNNFSWRDYYIRALDAANEPMINKKIDLNMQYSFLNHGDYMIGKRKGNAPELRRALEKVLQNRKPNAFIIDEAQHLAKIASGRVIQDQLDSIKSLASMTGVVHILIGTYELIEFRNLSGQLSRRSIDIHYPRYLYHIDKDEYAFKSVLLAFQRHIPIEEMPNLVDNWEYCYKHSIGCVGILKDWFCKALSLALSDGSKTLTMKHLEDTALSESQCEKIARETVEGENKLIEPKDESEVLRVILKMDDTKHNNINNACKPTQKIKNIGQRKPIRDTVGIEKQVA